jgi:hypothetical protein
LRHDHRDRYQVNPPEPPVAQLSPAAVAADDRQQQCGDNNHHYQRVERQHEIGKVLIKVVDAPITDYSRRCCSRA